MSDDQMKRRNKSLDWGLVILIALFGLIFTGCVRETNLSHERVYFEDGFCRVVVRTKGIAFLNEGTIDYLWIGCNWYDNGPENYLMYKAARLLHSDPHKIAVRKEQDEYNVQVCSNEIFKIYNLKSFNNMLLEIKEQKFHVVGNDSICSQ